MMKGREDDMDRIDEIKKRFEDTWNSEKGFAEKTMCEDGEYRLLENPNKIWAFFEKELKREKRGELGDELYEKLAAIEHERWAHWQKYMHSLSMEKDGEGEWACIPSEMIRRWNKQIETPYADLSEKEKNSDRDQVDKYWPLVEITGSTSDGYHTFDELYEHRAVLFIKLCEKIQDFRYHGDSRNRRGDEKLVWRSMLHSDGTMFDGWFIMGINRNMGTQMTYHLPFAKWSETDFAEDLCKAPEWDGHTAGDVLDRIASLL